MAKRKFHYSIRKGQESQEGKPVLAFGMRVGYWPCLRAPFISLSLWNLRIDVWHGLASACSTNLGGT